ncbi:TPA: hypothetical protein SMP34_000667 [Proteus mirabilis]|nr:hypothetical protein [Proteus mirabilis]
MEPTNPLSKLALDAWYKILIVGGFFVFILTGTGLLTAFPTQATVIISLGCAVWGVGEWINHPFQTILNLDNLGRVVGKMTGRPRKASIFGTVLDVLGLFMIARGIMMLI